MNTFCIFQDRVLNLIVGTFTGLVVLVSIVLVYTTVGANKTSSGVVEKIINGDRRAPSTSSVLYFNLGQKKLEPSTVGRCFCFQLFHCRASVSLTLLIK